MASRMSDKRREFRRSSIVTLGILSKLVLVDANSGRAAATMAQKKWEQALHDLDKAIKIDA